MILWFNDELWYYSELFEMFGHKLASRTMNTISLFGAVRDVRPQAGISNDEHDYTMKEFHDFLNYDFMI